MEIKELKIEVPEVTCEYALDKTPYKEVRWQRIPPRPNVFMIESGESGSNCPSFKVLFVFLTIIISKIK